MPVVRLPSLIAGFLAISLFLAACGDGGGATTTATEETGGAKEAAGGAKGAAGGAQKTTGGAKEASGAKEAGGAKGTTGGGKEATGGGKETKRKTGDEMEGKAGGGGADLEAGRQIFTSQANGCGSCHTLAAAGTHGTVGPNLDKALPGKSESFIRESIVDPEAEIAPGYEGGIMPTIFGSALSEGELEALLAYLQKSVGK